MRTVFMATMSFRDLLCSSLAGLILVVLTFGLVPGTQAKYDVSMFRTYFGCPPCDASLCKNPVGCELVSEADLCTCCMTCARMEGENCGINTAKCGQGLRCNPPENAINGFEALMEGKGACEPIDVFPGFPMSRRSQWVRSRRSKFGHLTNL